MNSETQGIRARFAVSLHPEIFFALQALSALQPRNHKEWWSRALERFPRREWPLDIPSGMWPAIADIVDRAPTLEFGSLLESLRAVPPRQLQERMLLGLLHREDAVRKLLDGGQPLATVVGDLPKAKREWLTYVGLYPLDPLSSSVTVLTRVIRDPESFRADVLATLSGFWESTFARTWRQLVPSLEVSVAEKERLFTDCTFPEFLRHSLLPIEFDGKRGVLRALRGGYELALKDIGQCTFTPSVFNDGRLWTVRTTSDSSSPWFPYVEPTLGPQREDDGADPAQLTPDVAMIFRAMGDATRFAIISLLGQQPRTSVELTKILSVSKPTISHHIHVLRSAGLIHETSHGKAVLISMNRSLVEDISDLAVIRIFESRGPLELSKSRRRE